VAELPARIVQLQHGRIVSRRVRPRRAGWRAPETVSRSACCAC
jgi:hypothetical protein